MKSQRSPIIEFPLSIILTAEGEYFFDKNNHAAGTLKTLRSKDQSKLSLTSYSARNLQWLITAGYVSQIEVIQTDFNSKRGELMDLANLISYGVLWKNYADQTFQSPQEHSSHQPMEPAASGQ